MVGEVLEEIVGAVPSREARAMLGLPRVAFGLLTASGILEVVNHQGNRTVSEASLDAFVGLMEDKGYVFNLQHRLNQEKGVSLFSMWGLVQSYWQILEKSGLVQALGDGPQRHHLFIYPLSREAELRAVLLHGISALGCMEEEAARICERFGLTRFHLRALVTSNTTLKHFAAVMHNKKVLNQSCISYFGGRLGLSPKAVYDRLQRRLEPLLEAGLFSVVGNAGSFNNHFLVYDELREEELIAAIKEPTVSVVYT